MPIIHVLSKNMENKKKSSENEHFYSREIVLYIAWACFRDEKCQKSVFIDASQTEHSIMQMKTTDIC